MPTVTNNTALILVDIQKGLDDPKLGERNNPAAEENCLKLLAAWRAAKRPVVHIQHLSVEPNSPLRPEKPGSALKDGFEPLPSEPHFTKSVNCAFIGTELEDHLRAKKIAQVVICGLTTNHCVSTTTRSAGNLGFDTILVGDATAAHARDGYDGTHFDADTIHSVALASLHNEFATVVNTAELV